MFSSPLARLHRSEAEPDQRPGWRWWGVRAALLYVGLVVVIQVLVWTGVLVARVAGNDPTSAMEDVPNFRVVDERVWAGGQPDAEAYRALAVGGVRLVVDLRTGAADDPKRDDPGFLESLGIAYVSLPVADGHVPSMRQVGGFATLVQGAPGRVYVHCGGGVGRTSALTAAYAMGSGDGATFADMVAIGRTRWSSCGSSPLATGMSSSAGRANSSTPRDALGAGSVACSEFHRRHQRR